MSKYSFQAEINELMSLIINSFYSNREIFLRELISNASDAIDKHRHVLLTDKQQTPGDDYRIRISTDKEAKTLTIEDNGIGMTRQDMIDNIGTIARSGTRAFMEKMKEGSDSLIGQFGVGFYSAYLVAGNVKVFASKDGEHNVWESDANGSFTIDEWSPDDELRENGSRIVLSLKDDQLEYLEEHKIRGLVKKHNQFISHPIELYVTRTVTEEVPVDDSDTGDKDSSDDAEEAEEGPDTGDKEPTDDAEEGPDTGDKEPTDDAEEGPDIGDKEPTDDADEVPDTGDKEPTDDVRMGKMPESEEVTVEDVDDVKPTTKKVDRIVHEYEQLNKDKPIWTRAPDDVSVEEYNAFYKSISNDFDDPIAKKHFNVEGQLEYRSILYIPKRAPFDLFEKAENKKSNNVKLYVKKVFVTDDSEALLPDWLSFVRGVVDSDDLPLNISREFLQQNKVMKTIQKNLVKKSLDMISDLDDADGDTFYSQFSKCLKLGAYNDTTHREKLLKLLRFHSSLGESMMTLEKYTGGAVDGQESVYYMCGESVEGMRKSPFIERCTKLGINVLLMGDPIDEYLMQHVREFTNSEDKKFSFVSVTKDGLKLPGEEDAMDSDEMKALCVAMKEVLGDKVEKVVTGRRIVDAPACIVTGQHGWSANMERIMKAQALRNDTMNFMAPKKIFEINPEHHIVKRLCDKLGGKKTIDGTTKDVVHLLYEVSLISSGFNFEDPSDFAKRMYRVIGVGTGADDEEVEVYTEIQKMESEPPVDENMEEID